MSACEALGNEPFSEELIDMIVIAHQLILSLIILILDFTSCCNCTVEKISQTTAIIYWEKLSTLLPVAWGDLLKSESNHREL